MNKLAEQYKLSTAEQVKAAVSLDALKHDLRLQKASELVVAEAKVGEAPKKEEGGRREAQEGDPQEEDRGRPLRRASLRRSPSAPARRRREESAEEPKAE